MKKPVDLSWIPYAVFWAGFFTFLSILVIYGDK